MALGDIVSVDISPWGWFGHVTIEGMGPSGVYTMGWNNSSGTFIPPISDLSFVLNATSSGFNDLGEQIEVGRLIYGGTGMRLPYPNENQNDETVNGGNVTVKITFTEDVYAKDQVTVNILSGMYSSGNLISSGATDLAVTNNSEIEYPKTVANWSYPAYGTIDGSTFDLRCAAFHMSAQSGRPVRVVKFTAGDENGNSVTGLETTPIIDDSLGDAVKIIEYKTTLSSSTLTQGSVVTGNFVAYPWIGDTGSILDTSDGLFTQPTPLYTPFQLICNKDGNYGSAIAVVNEETGNNGLGAAISSTSFNASDPPAAFKNMGPALEAIETYHNSNFSRNDIGNGIVYLQTGNHTFIGTTVSFGTLPNTWAHIRGYPGEDKDNILITGRDGSNNIIDKLKFQDVTFTGGATDVLNGMDHIWFDHCNLYYNGARFFISLGNFYCTRSNIYHLEDGLKPWSASDTSCPAIVRGNTFIDFDGPIILYNVIGNYGSGKFLTLTDYHTSQPTNTPQAQNTIFAFNKIYNFQTDQGDIQLGTQYGVTGAAIVQNLFEATGVSTSAFIDFYSSEAVTTNHPTKNILFWHNAFAGQRSSIAYNSEGSITKYRSQMSIRGNIFDNLGHKTDTFGTNDGNRTGNWSVNYGVNFDGNFYAQMSGQASALLPEFYGTNCVGFSGAEPPSPTGYVKYVDRQSREGDWGGYGFGDYNLELISPAIGLPSRILIPYDIDGNNRSDTYNAAGPYTNTGYLGLALASEIPYYFGIGGRIFVVNQQVFRNK